MRGNLYIVSAPSGSGKTTLLQHLITQYESLLFSISHTTRAPRGNEKDGVEYFFVDRKAFMGMVEDGEFLEWAEYHGNLYGTARRFVEDNIASGKAVILDIDVQGARQVKRCIPDAITIFLLPPSFEELERRLKQRRLEDDETIAKRLAIAKEEILSCHEYDYIIINDKVGESVELLDAIVRPGTRRPGKEVEENDRVREIVASFGGMV